MAYYIIAALCNLYLFPKYRLDAYYYYYFIKPPDSGKYTQNDTIEA